MSSVFKRNKMISKENHDRFPCSEGHTLDGVIPTINLNIMQVQHPEWVGKACDCKKLVYNENRCHCPAQGHWEIQWMPNPNY